MDDIEVDVSELSIPAKQTLRVIDSYIAEMKLNRDTIKMDSLQLYWERYEELDRSIRYHSEDNHSLATHTYCGIKIVSWDGD